MNNFSVFMIFIAAIFMGIAVGSTVTQRHFQEQAVMHGCAHYDKETGEWGWRNE